MESEFVNSRFLVESANVKFPSLPTESGEVLFVHPDSFIDFVENHLNSIQVPFTLLTHGSDYTFPYHYRKQSFKLLRNPFLIQWYAQNCIEPVGKLKQIPIGLNYKDPASWQEYQSTIEKLRKNSPEKRNKILGNFQFQMNTYYRFDRHDAVEKIPKPLIEYQEERLPIIQMLEHMATYKFIASPFGNGFDCHRTWEALAVGCIPIIHTSGLDPMFKGLPVLIIINWSDITEELLDSFFPETSQLEKLTQKYWVNLLYAPANTLT